MRALYRMIRALKNGTMILFPEGTRSRDGSVGTGRPGAGLVALANKPQIVPVTIAGMSDVLPIGANWPIPFQRVTILFGPPIDYSHLVGEERSKDTAQAVVDQVMAVVRYQYEWIRRYRAGEVGRDTPPWVEPGYAEALKPVQVRPKLAESDPEVDRLSLPDEGEDVVAVEHDESPTSQEQPSSEEE
jgi:hypothetical protein